MLAGVVFKRDLWHDTVLQPTETGSVLSFLDLAVPPLRVRENYGRSQKGSGSTEKYLSRYNRWYTVQYVTLR